jgi:ankyrin repeat protein
VGLRLIVVRTESEAANVLARLQAGEKFDELARTQSVDSTASAGGYLGILAIGQLRPEFQAVLGGLNPGQTSRIARIGRQFALLQVLPEEETRAIELKTWIDAGADPKSPIVDRLWTLAIASNNAGTIKTLLKAGAEVNVTFGDGSTVLMGAAQAGQLESVRALLAAGASVKAQTRDGTTALMVAAQAGRAEILRALLAAGADVNARRKNGAASLIDAAFNGYVDAVRVLLESRADPNITLEDGSTALMAASGKGQNDIVRALLRAGAQVNAGINTGGTALMEAAYVGHVETVRILLAAGADPKAATPAGATALMGASLGGHVDVVRDLLDAGADVNARDAKGWTALTYARASSKTPTVHLLLAKANISAEERSMALGGTYLNEYYSSTEPNLLELAAAEFQKILNVQPQNVAALEWMGAVEFLRWDKPPTLEQFRKANSFLKKSVDLDSKDPDRNYWIAAISSIFASVGKGASAANIAAILDLGIEHGKKAIGLDPQFADAMDHLSILYRRKAEQVGDGAEKDQLASMAASLQQDAARIRKRLNNRPSRFSDQFSRPSLPPGPR